jgi:hypothetical protein
MRFHCLSFGEIHDLAIIETSAQPSPKKPSNRAKLKNALKE